VQPERDIRIVKGQMSALDPSVSPADVGGGDYKKYPPPHGNSAMLIDATAKWPYPPVSLPARAFMENARKIWDELELPKLTPKNPWYGYDLGAWTKELEQEAALAVQGEHYKTGEKLAQQRVKL